MDPPRCLPAGDLVLPGGPGYYTFIHPYLPLPIIAIKFNNFLRSLGGSNGLSKVLAGWTLVAPYTWPFSRVGSFYFPTK